MNQPTIRVGVLGGGQLGKMLALCGVPLGTQFTFFDPLDDVCAAHVGDLVVGTYDNKLALDRFIDRVDVITYEFENVPVSAAEYVATKRPVWPPPKVLNVAQDRLKEKQFFQSLDIPTAPFAAVDSLDDLRDAVEKIGLPGVLKTRTMGYDGKGQCPLKTDDDIEEAWDALGDVPLIYEGFVEFTRELSIIGVRAQDGATKFYPLVKNDHSEGILRLSVAPAPDIAAYTQILADDYAERVLNAFGYVGVLAIELFDTPKGLLANEMAPRVHNSGHWTIEGSETSQFENHIRAVCGLPLGDTAMVGHAAMLNVIGTLPDVSGVLAMPNTHLHLYGKREAPRRKIGHITVRAYEAQDVQTRVADLRRTVMQR